MCVWETYIFEDICQCETANCSIDERVTDFSYLWKNALHIISKRTGSMMAGNIKGEKKRKNSSAHTSNRRPAVAIPSGVVYIGAVNDAQPLPPPPPPPPISAPAKVQHHHVRLLLFLIFFYTLRNSRRKTCFILFSDHDDGFCAAAASCVCVCVLFVCVCIALLPSLARCNTRQ